MSIRIRFFSFASVVLCWCIARIRVRQVSVATTLSLRKSTRKVIVLRTPPDQIASAVRLDCVRRPIRLRSVAVEKGGDLS